MAELEQRYTFFWRSNSPFSQWYLTKFYENGILFNCAEQYMMYHKAVLFGDKLIADAILNEKEPRKQKDLGRRVKNFVQEVWDASCQAIVKHGNKLKFSSNKKLKLLLFETAGTTLVEASPRDNIWGIGLTEDDPRARDSNQWLGKNLLGYILTEVRDELVREHDF